MIYSDVVKCFENAGFAVARIENQHGCVACISAAARVIAVAPDVDAENFLFNPPEIRDVEQLSKSLYCADGAPGGDRLWIAPENPYFCEIEFAKYVDHSRYFRPESIDPGEYQMESNTDSVVFSGDIEVLNKRSLEIAQMSIKRTVSQVISPFQGVGIEGSSYVLNQSLTVDRGLAGLWNIAQLPAGGTIVLPLKKPLTPTSYFNPAKFLISKNACAFPIPGDTHSKIGYGWEVATGDSAAFYWTGEELNMVYRQYAVIDGGYYCDQPSKDAPVNQVVQAWDGLGFGELEYHSVAAGRGTGVRSIYDDSVLHCLRGVPSRVLRLGSELLSIPYHELRQMIVNG